MMLTVCISCLRSEGYAIVERVCSRSSESERLAVNHGSVVVAGVSGVWLTAVDTGIQPITFESACVRVMLSSSSCIVLLIIAQALSQSAEFFRELLKLWIGW